MKKITIAIDGHSSTGKSTLAKQLANALGYIYVDSGAMYRAVTLFAMQNNYVSDDYLNEIDLIANLNKINLSFKFNDVLGFAEIYLNDVNVESKIRSIEVSKLVSKISAISAVRTQLVHQQQLYGKDKGVVMDGRDIGTVVFPDAELKIFMTASAEIRSQRRYQEMQEKNIDVSFDEVLKNVIERDRIDTTREDSPLVIAKDAIVIDNSNLTKEQQFNQIFALANNLIQN